MLTAPAGVQKGWDTILDIDVNIGLKCNKSYKACKGSKFILRASHHCWAPVRLANSSASVSDCLGSSACNVESRSTMGLCLAQGNYCVAILGKS